MLLRARPRESKSADSQTIHPLRTLVMLKSRLAPVPIWTELAGLKGTNPVFAPSVFDAGQSRLVRRLPTGR